MKNIESFLIILISLLLSNTANAQLQRDQDLVTLKNGYQILGYVVEQEPGKLIRVYRPEVPDTVIARYDEITKLTKIWVQSYSEKQVESTEMTEQDTIVLGRYNNKKNVFHATYIMQIRDIERYERQGFGLGYFKNFENKYWAGLSTYYFRQQDPRPNIFDVKIENNTLNQLYILFENKFRLAHRPQNRRLTTLLSLNAGYVADFSKARLAPTQVPLDAEYEEHADGLVLQGALTFRINPDNNSGFTIEPGFTYLPQNIYQYSAPKDESNSVFLGTYREVYALFTLKLGYFF